MGSPECRKRSSHVTESNCEEKRPKLQNSFPSIETYKASGLKFSLPGTIYQTKLLAFFLKRANTHEFRFYMATEMDAAEKFDDVVFLYRQNGKLSCRFIQIKHKLDSSKSKININDLKSPSDNDFSLQKYFISFCKVKNNKYFDNVNCEDFIILTNTTFDFEENRIYNKDGSENKKSKKRNDEILKWRNFLEYDDVQGDDKLLYFGKGEQIVNFKSSSLDVVGNLIKDTIESNIKNLEEKSRSENDYSRSSVNKTLETFQDMNKNFEKYIKEFYKVFRFVINYPNVSQLTEFIKEELGEEFNLLNTDLVYNSFNQDILHWVKSYSNFDTKEADFLTWQKGEDLFKQLKCKIHVLMISGQSQYYCAKLQEYRMLFKETYKKTCALLEFFSDEQHKYLLVQTNYTRLCALSLYEILLSKEFEEKCSYLKKRDCAIFLELKTLLSPANKYLLKDQSFGLLFIECDIKLEMDYEEIMKTLFDGVLRNVAEKIVVVFPNGMEIPASNDVKAHNLEINDSEFDFNCLQESSQLKVLETNVLFQGNKVALNTLIDIKFAYHGIDSKILNRLLNGEIIKIGENELNSTDEFVEDYYIHRKLLHKSVDLNILRKGCDTLLIAKDQILILDSEVPIVDEWNNSYKNKEVIIMRDSMLETQKLFLKLSKECVVVHWMMYHNNELFLVESSKQSKKLNKYVVSKVLQGDLYNLNDKVVIIANDAGMGKSTELCYLAKEIRKKDSNAWVIKMNLNNYTCGENSIQHVDFSQLCGKELLRCLSKMLVISENHLENNILEGALMFEGKFKVPKIVLLVDGFDEICPQYKKEMTSFLLALINCDFAKIVVTTRIHEKSHLEVICKAPAYTLNALEQPEQFLFKIWECKMKSISEEEKSHLFEKIHDEVNKHEVFQAVGDKSLVFEEELGEEKEIELGGEEEVLERIEIEEELGGEEEEIEWKELLKYAEIMMEKWYKSVEHSEKNIYCTFLCTKMLAEVIFHYKFTLLENFDVCNIYSTFFSMKYEIYNHDKLRTRGDNVAKERDEMISKLMHHFHCLLAVQEIFPYDNLIPIDVFNELCEIIDSNEDVAKTKVARIGIMCLSGNKLSFIHRSFAEYACSEYLCRKIKYENVQKKIFSDIICNDDYDLLNSFLNGVLVQKFSDKDFKISESAKLILLKDFENSDLSKTLLFKVIRNDHGGLLKLLLYFIDNNCTSIESLVLRNSRVRGMTFLHPAIWNKNCEIVKMLLNKFLVLNHDVVKNMILKHQRGEGTILILATHWGNEDVISSILHFVREYFPTFVEEFVLQEDCDGENILNQESFLNEESCIKLIELMHKNLGYEVVKKLILHCDHKQKTSLFRAVENMKCKLAVKLLDMLNLNDQLDLIFKTDWSIILPEMLWSHLTQRLIVKIFNRFMSISGCIEELLIFALYYRMFLRENGRTNIMNAISKSPSINDKLANLQMVQSDIEEKIQMLGIDLNSVDDIKVLMDRDDYGTLMLCCFYIRSAIHNNSSQIVKLLLENLLKYERVLKMVLMNKNTSLYWEEKEKTLLEVGIHYNSAKCIEVLLTFVKEKLGKETVKEMILILSTLHETHLSEGYGASIECIIEFVVECCAEKEILQIMRDLGGVEKVREWTKERGIIHLLQKLEKFVEENISLQFLFSAKNNKAEFLRIVKDSNDQTFQKCALATDEWERTVLHLAVSSSQRDTVLFFLNRVKEIKDIRSKKRSLDIILMKKDVNGQNFLHVSENGIAVLKWFIEYFNSWQQIVRELLLGVDLAGYNVLHMSPDPVILLQWIKECFGNKNIIQELILSGSRTYLRVKCGFIFLVEWVQSNITELYPEAIENLLFKSNDQGILVPSEALRNCESDLTFSVLKWVEENLDEVLLRDLIMQPDYCNRCLGFWFLCDSDKDTIKCFFEFLRPHVEVLKEVILIGLKSDYHKNMDWSYYWNWLKEYIDDKDFLIEVEQCLKELDLKVHKE